MNIRGSKGHEKTTSGQDDLYLNNLTVYDSTILEGPVSLKRQNTLQNPLLNQVNLLIPNYEFVSYNFEFPSSAGTAGQVFVSGGGSSPNYWVTPGTGGIGTVTSVGINTPSLFTVTGSPITTSGTITLTYSGTPLPILYGGTGLTVVGTSGQVLQSTGTSLVYTTPGSGGIGTVTSVAVTVPSFLSVSGSPITTSGTISITGASTGYGIVVLDNGPTITNGHFVTPYITGPAIITGDQVDVQNITMPDKPASLRIQGGLQVDKNLYVKGSYNDDTDSGTVASVACNVFDAPILSATHPTLYVESTSYAFIGAPIAGTNVTLPSGPLTNFCVTIEGGLQSDDQRITGTLEAVGDSSFEGVLNVGTDASLSVPTVFTITNTTQIVNKDTSVYYGASYTTITAGNFLYIGQSQPAGSSYLPVIQFQGPSINPLTNPDTLLTLSVLSVDRVPRITFGSIDTGVMDTKWTDFFLGNVLWRWYI